MAGAVEVRWAPRVAPHRIRRLYETDALGIVDEEQIDDVGLALYVRCQSILRATAAHKGRVTCPRCEATVPRAGSVWNRRQPLRCDACGWATTWGAYYDTYKGRYLKGGSASAAFHHFVERYPAAATPRARMLEIDRLLHAFHHELKASTRPAGINLIEGTLADVLDFLQRLTDGPPRRCPSDGRPSDGRPPDGRPSDTAAAQEDEQARRHSAIARAQLGNRLRTRRRALRLTGPHVAARAGMSVSKVSNMETGRKPPTGEDVRRLAPILELSPEEATEVAAQADSLLPARRPTLSSSKKAVFR